MAAWNDGATWNIAVRTGLIRCAPGPLVRTAKVFRHSRAHESPFYARDHRRAHGMRSRCERESPHGTEVKRGNAQEVPGPGVVVDGRRDRHGGGPGRRWQWLKTIYRPSHLRHCPADAGGRCPGGDRGKILRTHKGRCAETGIALAATLHALDGLYLHLHEVR